MVSPDRLPQMSNEELVAVIATTASTVERQAALEEFARRPQQPRPKQSRAEIWLTLIAIIYVLVVTVWILVQDWSPSITRPV